MKEALSKLHIAVFLAGTSGLFGRWITMSETMLALYRVILSALILGVVLLAMKLMRKHAADSPARITARTCLGMSGIGTLLVLHWLFFFGSIKAANVSIGAVCLSLVPFITAILEPLLLRSRFSLKNFLISIISVLGVACIFGVDTQFRLGIAYGTISSTLLSLMMIANKSMRSHKVGTTDMLFGEFVGGGIVLLAIVACMKYNDPTMPIFPSAHDWLYLLLLAAIVTITPYLLKLQVLNTVDAFTVNLVNNMEPVYSILLAIIIFNEAQQLSFAFVIGVVLILISVTLQTFHSLKH